MCTGCQAQSCFFTILTVLLSSQMGEWANTVYIVLQGAAPSAGHIQASRVVQATWMWTPRSANQKWRESFPPQRTKVSLVFLAPCSSCSHC